MTVLFHGDPGGTRIRAGDGKFDSRNRYLHKSVAAGAFGVAAGPTLDVQHVTWVGTLPAGTYHGIAWRQSINGYVIERPAGAVEGRGGTFPTLSFNATVTTADILQDTGATPGLKFTAGRLRVADTDGTVAFDSDQQMFFATDYKQGSVDFVAHSNLNASVEINTDTVLASINPNANAVLGFFKITSATDATIPAGAWAQIGGTWIRGFATSGTSVAGDFRFVGAIGGGSSLTHFVAYSFRAAGGSLIINEKVYLMRVNTANLASGTVTGTEAFTLTYRALCGAFDA